MRSTSFKLLAAIVITASLTAPVFAQSKNKKATSRPATNAVQADTVGMAAANLWADKKMKHMSLTEKVAQLMFVRVPTNMTKKQQKEFDKIIRNQHVGGICFFKGTAARQLEQTRRYQQMADIPLMVTIDGEWGLGMRLTDCFSFPRQMMMGALTGKNDTLIRLFGEEVGRQCKKMGIHVNFAPVADINSNPLNPIIGTRSFGENKKRVARKADYYARGMQRQGIIAVGKHFPGHGDTETDSHLTLPVVKHSKAHIDSVNLYPFERLIAGGIRGMMVAHLQVNAYDARPTMPSSLSELIVAPLLREKMHFDGLIFTDGIDMKAVSNYYKDGEGAIRAIRAGSDVILLPIDVIKTIGALVVEARNDKAFAAMIDDRCHRILREKYRCGLHELKLDKLSVPNKKDWQRSSDISYAIAQKAITLVRNNYYALPLNRQQKVVNIAVGNSDTAVKTLTPELKAYIKNAKTVVISLFANQGSGSNYGVSAESVRLINDIADLDSVISILVIYGSPYILQSFPQRLLTNGKTTANAANAISNAVNNYPKGPSAIVMAYQQMDEMCRAVPPALYGEQPFEGRLPVSAGNYAEGTALKPQPRPKNDYAAVVKAGLKVDCFKAIDSLALNGIRNKAYPGCQILVAKDGKIVYNQCYGKLSYDANAAAVDTGTVYDLASLTKITATTLAVMKLVDAGKVNLDDRLSRYLPYLKHSNKKRITLRQALSHMAALKSFDAYWKGATADSNFYVGDNPPDNFTAIGDKYYVRNNYRASVLLQIADSKLEKSDKYLYSDLGFILLGDMVSIVSGQSLDIFMQQHFYGPLQMKHTTFRPLQHGIALRNIAPTEEEKNFRKQTLRGYVHDPNAAAMGGVSGHAGLFSTATDLFRLFQMMLNEGAFEGKQYVSAETFRTFNQRYYATKGCRRALGFDKPLINSRSSHVSPKASQSSFGHTGFTGTMVWVDPEYNLIYIFLSNRVHPSASPNKLANMNIRTDIQEQIYMSMGI